MNSGHRKVAIAHFSDYENDKKQDNFACHQIIAVLFMTK